MKFKFILFCIVLFPLHSLNAAYHNMTEADQTRIKDVLPTTYYIAKEEKTSCVGRYGGVDYQGHEKSDVLTPAAPE